MYVFIDLEACNQRNMSSICAMGILVVNSRLKIKKQQYILIDPQDKFDIDQRMDIGVKPQMLVGKSTFDALYPFLVKKYLNEKNIIVGHAVENDLKMLGYACKKYRLPSLKLRYLSTNLLYSLYKEKVVGCSLSKIAEEIGYHFVPHHAMEDTLAAYQVAKFVAKAKKMNLDQLLKAYAIDLGQYEDFKTIFPNTSPFYTGRAVKISAYSRRDNHVLLNDFLKHVLPQVAQLDKKNPLYGKTVCFDSAWATDDIFLTRTYIQQVYNLGGKYQPRGEHAHYYILENADSPLRFTPSRKTKIMYKEDFLKLLKPLPFPMDFSADKYILRDYRRERFRQRALQEKQKQQRQVQKNKLFDQEEKLRKQGPIKPRPAEQT